MKKTLFLFLFFILFIAGCGVQNLPPANSDELLKLHNAERTKKKLKPFYIDEKLVAYAQKHAEWMAKKNTMKHSNVNNLLKDFNLAGENIAWNQKDEAEVTNAWMNSRPHRANILNGKFGKIGFGMARNSKGQPYWCTVFGD